MKALGIDIGGSCVKVAVREGDAIVAQRSGEPYVNPECDALAVMVRSLVGDARACDCVGVAAPGPLDGETLVQAVNMPALVGVDLAEWVRALLDVRCAVRVMTDASAAASWEHHLSPRSGRSLYLAMGTGVGGAVLDDGVALYITRGTPGHFGAIDVGDGTLQDRIGLRGLEQAGVPIDELDCFEHRAAQPALAALARAIRILLVMYRPDAIVFMGGLGVKLGGALPMLDALVRTNLSEVAPAHFTLSIARSDRFAAACGATR